MTLNGITTVSGRAIRCQFITVGRRCMSTSGTVNKNKRTRAMLDRMLRVDQAGEFGAVQIYKGQIAVLSKTSEAPLLKEMLKQEEHHLDTFNKLLPQHRVRPTALMPIWNIAGFMLGAGTALLGKESAMACTVAVETVIGQHYDNQLRKLVADGSDGSEKHKDLIEIIREFRDDELEHLDTGLDHNAEQAPFYQALTGTIKAGCRTAIWLSERI